MFEYLFKEQKPEEGQSDLLSLTLRLAHIFIPEFLPRHFEKFHLELLSASMAKTNPHPLGKKRQGLGFGWDKNQEACLVRIFDARFYNLSYNQGELQNKAQGVLSSFNIQRLQCPLF